MTTYSSNDIPTLRFPSNQLTVIIGDDTPMVLANDSPTYRSVRITLTEEQMGALALQYTGTSCGVHSVRAHKSLLHRARREGANVKINSIPVTTASAASGAYTTTVGGQTVASGIAAVVQIRGYWGEPVVQQERLVPRGAVCGVCIDIDGASWHKDGQSCSDCGFGYAYEGSESDAD